MNGDEMEKAAARSMQTTSHEGVEAAAGEVYTPKKMTALAPIAHETAGMALAAQAKALVEARYVIAQRMPRDIDVVRRKLLKECERPAFADSALYAIKRGGKTIEGPSIRLAEAALREMSNVVVDTVTVYDDDEKRIVRVTVTDVESNLSYSLDVNVRKAVERRHFKDGDVVIRSRVNSTGQTVYLIEASEGDLVIAQAAAVSKAIRTNGLRLVPGWLVDECVDTIHATLRNRDAKDPDAAKRKLFDSFDSLGIGPEKVKLYLGHEAEHLTEVERASLRGLYAALRDGEVTWAQVEAALGEKGEQGKPDGAAALRARLASAGKPAAAPHAPGGTDAQGGPSSPAAGAPGVAAAPPPAETAPTGSQGASKPGPRGGK